MANIDQYQPLQFIIQPHYLCPASSYPPTAWLFCNAGASAFGFLFLAVTIGHSIPIVTHTEHLTLSHSFTTHSRTLQRTNLAMTKPPTTFHHQFIIHRSILLLTNASLGKQSGQLRMTDSHSVSVRVRSHRHPHNCHPRRCKTLSSLGNPCKYTKKVHRAVLTSDTKREYL